MNNEKKARAKVRMQRLLKHYRNTLQTKAGNPTEETVDDLLVDLHHYCELMGIDLVERMTEAAIATEPPAPVQKVVRTAPHPDFVVTV